MIRTAAVLVALAAAAAAHAQSADAIVGAWRTADGQGDVEIERCGDAVCGTLVRVEVAGVDVPRDVNNPDRAERDRRLQGLEILSGLEYAGGGQWRGGTIYDPDSGHTYSVKAELDGPDTLKLRGYVLVPLFGRTATWYRVGSGKEPPPRQAPVS